MMKGRLSVRLQWKLLVTALRRQRQRDRGLGSQGAGRRCSRQVGRGMGGDGRGVRGWQGHSVMPGSRQAKRGGRDCRSRHLRGSGSGAWHGVQRDGVQPAAGSIQLGWGLGKWVLLAAWCNA